MVDMTKQTSRLLKKANLKKVRLPFLFQVQLPRYPLLNMNPGLLMIFQMCCPESFQVTSDSKLMLGMWQQIVLFEIDTRQRTREIIVQIMGE